MSGLAALLAGRVDPGVYLWHGAFDVDDVRHAVGARRLGLRPRRRLAGRGGKPGFLAAVGEALDFPDWYGHNFDALADCLHDVGRGDRRGRAAVGRLGARWPATTRRPSASPSACSGPGCTPTGACRSRCCCAARVPRCPGLPSLD